jgi:hypothetical protein
MNGTQWEAFRAAAADGLSLDGLAVEGTDGAYVFETPETRRVVDNESELRAAAEEHAAFVTNWYFWTQAVGDDGNSGRYAYLRWLEGADERPVPARYDALVDGVTREWGELLVTVRLGEDGGRRYEVRHEADGDADREALSVRTDPLEARDIAKYDGDGRYRPLKTAPSLPTGWVFADLSPADLLRTVDFVYPATVTNWHLEREGGLDVTHWTAAAGRQTGIYEVVEELPPTAVEWAAEACCVDSQCLKRREWDLDGEHPLDVPRGDGAFPCREPCSLLIAAAREWTKLEREETRTYELELTPSEREQIEGIVDAVAEGRIDEIREADVDDGANRYRARYLRAKRFSDGEGDAAHDEHGDGGHREDGDEHGKS